MLNIEMLMTKNDIFNHKLTCFLHIFLEFGFFLLKLFEYIIPITQRYITRRLHTKVG